MTATNVRTSEARVRVLIVDDHAIVRKGIRALLSEADGFEVVGEADNGQAAVQRAEESSPDPVYGMPIMSSIPWTAPFSPWPPCRAIKARSILSFFSRG